MAKPFKNSADTLLQLLREKGDAWLEVVGLAKAMQVHKRTITRALTELKGRGAEFEEEHSPGGRNRIHMIRPPHDDETMSAQTGLALSVARLFLKQAGTDVWSDHLGEVEAFAKKRMRERERQMADALSRRLIVRGTVSDYVTLNEGVLDNVLSALGGEIQTYELEIAYKSPREEVIKEYRLVPHVLIHDAWSGGAFLLGWLPELECEKQFKLERIQRAHCTSRLGHIPDLERMKRFANYHFGGWSSSDPPIPYEVHVLDVAWAQSLLEAEPALPDLTLHPQTDGTLKVRFNATDIHVPLRWALQFGPRAKVLGPPIAQAKIVEDLRAALALYDNAGG